MEGANYSCFAKNISINERHQIALQPIRHNEKVTAIANEKQGERLEPGNVVYAANFKERYH